VQPRIAIVIAADGDLETAKKASTSAIVCSVLPHITKFDFDIVRGAGLPLDKYDLIHLVHPHVLHLKEIPVEAFAHLPPITCNVWDPPFQELPAVAIHLQTYFTASIVYHPMFVSLFGQLGVENVFYAPLSKDYSDLRALQLPLPEVFTVGTMGTDNPIRRIHITEAAARLAGVQCHIITYSEHRTTFPLNPVEDFLSKISLYIHCGFANIDSMNARDALCVGRPVVTTRVPGLGDLIEPGVNGMFYDGTPEGAAAAIGTCRPRLEDMSRNARITSMVTPSEVASYYERCWSEVLEVV